MGLRWEQVLLFGLVDALNSASPTYDTLVPKWVDLGNWARVSAAQRIAGNWDSYTMNRGKNCKGGFGVMFDDLLAAGFSIAGIFLLRAVSNAIF